MGVSLYLTIHAFVIISIFFETKSWKTKNYVLWFWIIFFTCFGGLRWRIGNDWEQYYFYFENCSINHIFDTIRYGNDYLEPGFVLLQSVSKIVLGKYYVYNILLTFFYQYTIVYISKRYSHQYPILMYAFIMTATGTASYGAVRAGLAAAIMYWAYPCIEKRQLKEFLTLIFIGANIHVLCLVMLPFYWGGKFKFNYLSATMLYFTVAFSSIIFRDYFLSISMFLGGNIAYKAGAYTSSETIGYAESTSFGWILYYILFMMFIYIRKYYKNEYFYNCLLMLYFANRAIILVFSDGMGDLSRLTAGLGPVFATLVIFSITALVNMKKTIATLIAVMMYISISTYLFLKIDDGYYFEDSYVPYKTIFDYKSLGVPVWQ